jgi:hypothetical protein
MGTMHFVFFALLQFAYNCLFKASSVREICTVKYFREKLNRRNVTADKVTKSYEGCEQFLVSIGIAYICEAAMEFWGLDDLDGKPTKHAPQPGMIHLPLWKKKEYFDEVIGEFVDEFVMADPDKEAVNQHKKNQESLTRNIHLDHDYAKIDTCEYEKDSEATNSTIPTDDKTDKVRYIYIYKLLCLLYTCQN